jgi:FtsP/CotA-like multicopper oxidase with cupredoxin domain
MKYAWLLLIITVVVGCTSVAQVEYHEKNDIELTIAEYEYAFIEDKPTTIYAFNGQIPGPVIEGDVGETLKILVTNTLDTPTSIHWHGLLLENKNDGVPYITQDPIMPQESRLYTIPLHDAGLFWYHSHFESAEQVEKGLHGAFLVHENDSIGADNELVLVLDDVLLDAEGQFRDFNLGRMHGRFGNILLLNGKRGGHMDMQGAYNRLRIVNTANARSFNLYFGKKTVTVIGEGIGRVSPYDAKALKVHPGERYDVIIHSDDDEQVSISHLRGRDDISIAVLNISVPDYERTPINLSYELAMPFDETIYDREPDFVAFLQGIAKPVTGLAWTINGKTYPDNPEQFVVKEGAIVKIRVTNTQGQSHPMHLHGQKFMVLSRNGEDEKKIAWRDTVMLGPRETIDIAFQAQNKGTWIFHCHILEHAEAGMLSLIEVV